MPGVRCHPDDVLVPEEFYFGPALTLPPDWDADEMLFPHVLRCVRCRFVLRKRRRVTRRLRPGDPGE